MNLEELSELEAVEAVEIPEPVDSPPDWRLRAVLVGVAVGLFMGALENTIVGTAMPTIIATLNGIEIYSWVFAAYILSSTIMTPIWGKMADLVGRRPAMFWGLALFIVGSSLSGLSQSMPQLIAFRTLQGMGAGAMFPVGMTMIADLLTLEKRTRMVALFSGMWGFASLVGPLVGGWLTQHLSWHWVFYINLPFGILSVALIWWGYTEKHGRRKNLTLDYAGAVTLSGALILLMLAIEGGINRPGMLTGLALVAGILLLVAFVWIERRSPEPLIPLDLFHYRMVKIAVPQGFFLSAALIGLMAFLPLFVQAVINTSPTEAGMTLTPFILAWVASTIIGSRFLLRVGYRPVVITGMSLMTIATFLLARVHAGTTRAELIPSVVMLGLGGGINMSSLMLAVQHAVPARQIGVVTSTLQFARNTGAAMGTATMGALMSWRLNERLSGAGGELAKLAGQDISSLILKTGSQTMSEQSGVLLRGALADSLRLSFLFVLVSSVIALLLTLYVPGGRAGDLAHTDHQ